MDEKVDNMINCFLWGVDYGLLLAEEERDSEDLLDAAICASYAIRMCAPSSITPRRQSHSATWRKAMGSGLLKLIELVKQSN